MTHQPAQYEPQLNSTNEVQKLLRYSEKIEKPQEGDLAPLAMPFIFALDAHGASL